MKKLLSIAAALLVLTACGGLDFAAPQVDGAGMEWSESEGDHVVSVTVDGHIPVNSLEVQLGIDLELTKDAEGFGGVVCIDLLCQFRVCVDPVTRDYWFPEEEVVCGEPEVDEIEWEEDPVEEPEGSGEPPPM